MKNVRFGIIGLGNMGSHHARQIPTVAGAALTAVCDIDAAKLKKFTTELGVPGFASHRELLDSGLVDAIVIAVPHYDHVPIAIDAFGKNVHVLCEKPLAVSVKAARQVAEEYKKHPHLKFGIMFQMRTSPMYRKLRDVITSGELGEISRITWLVTNWFRTWTYYASGGWRATWKGEGGGTLINQCPHNLDMIQWVTGGMKPSRVTAVGFVGKTHPIETEDEMSAILEYPNGAIGHFVTSTGEAPGTNRLEIAGERGKIVCEGGKLTFTRTRKGVQEVNRTSPESFATLETWVMEIPHEGTTESHKLVTERFVETVLKDLPNASLIAEGTEGVHGLEIGNAMMMAGLTRVPVSLPVDGDAFDAFIEDMHKKYGGKKTLETKEAASVNLMGSFQRT